MRKLLVVISEEELNNSTSLKKEIEKSYSELHDTKGIISVIEAKVEMIAMKIITKESFFTEIDDIKKLCADASQSINKAQEISGEVKKYLR